MSAFIGEHAHIAGEHGFHMFDESIVVLKEVVTTVPSRDFAGSRHIEDGTS